MALKTFLKVSSLAACVVAGLMQAAQADEVKTLVAGELRVGMEVSYPPFEYYEGDKVVGFDPDVSTELAKRLGLKMSVHDTRFPNLILGLNAGRFDTIISGMYILPERLEQADAIPYAATGAAIMVKSDADVRPATAEELCGLPVGMQQGTSWIKKLNDLSAEYCVPNGKAPIKVNEYPTTSEASQALLSGHIKAHLEIDAASKLIVEKSRGRLAISSTSSVYPQVLGIYVKKGNKQLLDALEKALNEFKASGDYAELLKQHNLEEA